MNKKNEYIKYREGSPSTLKWACWVAIVLFTSLVIINTEPANKPKTVDKTNVISGKEVTLSKSGSIVYMEGNMYVGFSDQFANLVRKGKSEDYVYMKTLVINSKGGNLGEAYKLAEMVNNLGLTVHVEGVCASACTVFYSLVKGDRTASLNAKFGFHQSTGGYEADTMMCGAYMQASIKAAPVCQAMFSTPNSEVTWVSSAAMTKYGVVNRISTIPLVGIVAETISY